VTDEFAFTCTWPYDGGELCGKPANGFRMTFYPEKKGPFYFCHQHKLHLWPDERAREVGYETYYLVFGEPVTAWVAA
jgi:hypothetical protein